MALAETNNHNMSKFSQLSVFFCGVTAKKVVNQTPLSWLVRMTYDPLGSKLLLSLNRERAGLPFYI
ncbi:MAG: hypothetical protein DHS20C08_24300 [Rhodomicrobium sp.]|nr:MAG: hypothetical protein DHS20C08_24300 [Rhodomicrobium sp.]